MLQRRRARVGLGTAVLLAAAPAVASANCPGADVRSGASTRDSARSAMRCLINQERAKHGLSRLTSHRQLRTPADSLAGQMVAKRFFAHVTPDGKTMLSRLEASGYVTGHVKRFSAGEVIGYGSRRRATPRWIVKRWLQSPEHRPILLDRRFRQIGVGLSDGSPFGDRNARTFAVDFGVRAMRGTR